MTSQKNINILRLTYPLGESAQDYFQKPKSIKHQKSPCKLLALCFLALQRVFIDDFLHSDNVASIIDAREKVWNCLFEKRESQNLVRSRLKIVLQPFCI